MLEQPSKNDVLMTFSKDTCGSLDSLKKVNKVLAKLKARRCAYMLEAIQFPRLRTYNEEKIKGLDVEITALKEKRKQFFDHWRGATFLQKEVAVPV